MARNGKSAIVSRATTDPRFYPDFDKRSGFRTRSLLAVPLSARGLTIGVLEVVNKVDYDFDESDLALVETLAASAAIAIHNAHLFDQLQQSNLHLGSTLEELEMAQEQLVQHERLAAVGQLAAGIAHEFNNMMAPITLYSDILLRSHQHWAEQQERLQVIHAQATRASELTQQILDFSRRAVLVRKEIEMVPFVQRITKMLGQILSENIRVEFSFDSDTYRVAADPVRIQQVIVNLALNARDAMQSQGGGVFRIELKQATAARKGRPDQPMVELMVSDTGEGIPNEVLPHIFEPFFHHQRSGRRERAGPGPGSRHHHATRRHHRGLF